VIAATAFQRFLNPEGQPFLRASRLKNLSVNFCINLEVACT
jgi:hypothetical protein